MTSLLNRSIYLMRWHKVVVEFFKDFLTEAAANRTSHRLVRRFVTQNQVRPTHSLSSEQQQHQQQHNRQTAWLGPPTRLQNTHPAQPPTPPAHLATKDSAPSSATLAHFSDNFYKFSNLILFNRPFLSHLVTSLISCYFCYFDTSSRADRCSIGATLLLNTRMTKDFF